MNQSSENEGIISDACLLSGVQRLSHRAMGTIFEIFIVHKEPLYAEQAAFAAFGELDRLEQELSRYIENSDIARINDLEAGRVLKIGLDTFECLKICERAYNETKGAFDASIGMLMDCRCKDKMVRRPSKKELDFALSHTGFNFVKLDEREHTVELETSPVRIDLGGVGKGYAVEQMGKLLREWSIETALVHGGCSSVLALNGPAQTKGWPVTFSNPENRKEILAKFDLQNRALSGSGMEKGGHIIDPRTGRAVVGKIAAWVCADGAGMADALSTAFMVMTPREVEEYCKEHQTVSAMVMIKKPGGKNLPPEIAKNEVSQGKILRFGEWGKEF